MQQEKEEALRKQVELELELDSRQKLELEKEQLRGKIEVMKMMGSEEDGTLKELDELRTKLEEKDDDMESMDSLNQALIIKNQRTIDELKEAKKELINVYVLSLLLCYEPMIVIIHVSGYPLILFRGPFTCCAGIRKNGRSSIHYRCEENG